MMHSMKLAAGVLILATLAQGFQSDAEIEKILRGFPASATRRRLAITATKLKKAKKDYEKGEIKAKQYMAMLDEYETTNQNLKNNKDKRQRAKMLAARKAAAEAKRVAAEKERAKKIAAEAKRATAKKARANQGSDSPSEMSVITEDKADSFDGLKAFVKDYLEWTPAKGESTNGSDNVETPVEDDFSDLADLMGDWRSTYGSSLLTKEQKAKKLLDKGKISTKEYLARLKKYEWQRFEKKRNARRKEEEAKRQAAAEKERAKNAVCTCTTVTVSDTCPVCTRLESCDEFSDLKEVVGSDKYHDEE